MLVPTNGKSNLVSVVAVEDLKDGDKVTKSGETFVIDARYLLTKRNKRRTVGKDMVVSGRYEPTRLKRLSYKPERFEAGPASSANRSRKFSFSESSPTKRLRKSNSKSSTKTMQSPRTSAARTLTLMGNQ